MNFGLLIIHIIALPNQIIRLQCNDIVCVASFYLLAHVFVPFNSVVQPVALTNKSL